MVGSQRLPNSDKEGGMTAPLGGRTPLGQHRESAWLCTAVLGLHCFVV